MMKEVFSCYKNHPPSVCLVEVLIDLAVTIQGGIDRASGHRYSLSSGDSYKKEHLHTSLKNLHHWLLHSNATNDTSQIIKNISNKVKDGGCYKIGNVSATELLTIFHLSGCGKNLHHTVNAVIKEKTATAKFLEKEYGFNRNQRGKLLPIAKLRLPLYKTNVVENATCKMGIEQSSEGKLQCDDTVFANQIYIYMSDGKVLNTLDKFGNIKKVVQSRYKQEVHQMNERIGCQWYETTFKENNIQHGQEDICLSIKDIFFVHQQKHSTKNK